MDVNKSGDLEGARECSATASSAKVRQDDGDLAPLLSQRRRILTCTTLVMAAIAVPFAVQYWRICAIDMVVVMVAAVSLAFAHLWPLRRAARIRLAGHVAVALLFALIVCSSMRTGGFSDPSFVWLFIVPLAAAVLIDVRVGWIWTALVFAVVVAFWLVESSGVQVANVVPMRDTETHDLLHRLAVIAVAVVTSSFVLAQGRAERDLVAANAQLERELDERKRAEADARASEHARSEDNPINQRLALRQLDKLGFGADAVADGREALAMVDRIDYSAVLMDCHLPEMDEFEATAAIRRRASAKSGIPIIAMSASVMSTERQRALDAGMDDYLTKPVQLVELGATLDKWCRRPALAAGTVESLAIPEWFDGLDGPGGDRACFIRFAHMFLADAPRKLRQLRDAASRGDAHTVAELAHTLAGSAATLGFGGLTQRARELEMEAATSGTPDSARIVAELEDELDRAREELPALSAAATEPRDARRQN